MLPWNGYLQINSLQQKLMFGKASESHRAFEAAKHIYDLAVICKHEKVVNLLSNTKQTKGLLDIRISEEYNHFKSVPDVLLSEKV
ncbi:hypothetical protein [Peptoanaerobacter stomatis]|uniref:hypothetical protein n=1 Tax=Peptoanaerobacter stomatis TaxID=796937 RepID=UPI003F9EC108